MRMHAYQQMDSAYCDSYTSTEHYLVACSLYYVYHQLLIPGIIYCILAPTRTALQGIIEFRSL